MSGQKTVTPTAESLEQAVRAAKSRGLPPVEKWNPPFSGDIDMHIARDGRWFYEGSEIRRPGLARLFSTILKKEGDRFFLVTPVEKVGITVEDAPFVAVDVEPRGNGEAPEEQVLEFLTNMGDSVAAGSDHPIRVERDPHTDEPSPYVHVRAGLEALIDRKSFYRLVELGVERDGWFGLWSNGAFFPVYPAAELK